MSQEFIPGTMEREIAKDIVFRPIKSWHSNTFAGERLEFIPGTKDRSCCMKKIDGMNMCSIPYTVTHRLYWNRNKPEQTISAFLSYPNGLIPTDSYMWEALVGGGCRYSSEEEMEKAIIRELTEEEIK